jgi:SM-20-related protein
MTTAFIDLAALQNASLQESPFPYTIIPRFIQPNYLSDLVHHFPSITSRGSIPSDSLHCAPMFRRFIQELEGPALRQAIGEKFAMDLRDKPTMLTLRGYTTERDGLIHTDSKSKLITVLLYMNLTWETHDGKLRLLNTPDSLDDYFAEISPLAGNCLIFKVTPNGWHGHHPFIGKRLSLQLNYLANDAALVKHLNHHRLTAFFKRYFPKFLRGSSKNNSIEENY